MSLTVLVKLASRRFACSFGSLGVSFIVRDMREMLSNLTEDMFKKGLVVLFLLSFESKKSAMVVYEHNKGGSLTSIGVR